MQIGVDDLSSFKYHVSGTYKSDSCGIFCVDHLGRLLPNLMCRSCAKVPYEDDFKKRLQRRVQPASNDLQTPLDRIPTAPLLLERARQSASTCHRQRFQLLRVRRELTRSRASVITLERRLEERALTGDLASIAVDLQYLQTKDKLNGKAVAIKFVKDLVHQMRLGKSSRNMRWAESSKRLMAVLKKWGGPRSLRLLRENVGGASDRTVGRTWTAKIFRYPLGEHECIVMQATRRGRAAMRPRTGRSSRTERSSFASTMRASLFAPCS